MEKQMEKRKLNLEGFEIESAEINIGNGKVLEVSADIPLTISAEFYEISQEDGFTKADQEKMIDIMKKILCLKNDKKIVDDFFDGLSSRKFVKIVTFITTYINEVIESDKKKDS